jgi:hypothetical protein
MNKVCIEGTVIKSEVMMSNKSNKPMWMREELLQLLTLSGTLAGLSITGVTLFHTMDIPSFQTTVADDILVATSLLFLLCTYIIFFALRIQHERLAIILERTADVLFLLALSSMVASGFVMVFTII